MRSAFIETLIELAQKDKKIFLLCGDLGYSVLEPFAKNFPDRFINCGIAEQNMMGLAAGLALSGKKPYVYSIVPFATMRCFEQIRNDVCYQNLNVKIIGMGGGFTYGPLGATHQALEDVAVLRALPNMNIFCPADPVETKALVLQSYLNKKPAYFRLSRKGLFLHKETDRIKISQPAVLKKGKDGLIVASGLQAGFCLEVAQFLKKQGKDFKVISLHTLKPILKAPLLKEMKGINNIFTVEEHSVIGGLGAAVAEILAESDWQGKFRILGVPDEYPNCAGSVDYLRKKYSLDKEMIIKKILKETKK